MSDVCIDGRRLSESLERIALISARLSEPDEFDDSFVFEGAEEDLSPVLFLGKAGVSSIDGLAGFPTGGGSPSAGLTGAALS